MIAPRLLVAFALAACATREPAPAAKPLPAASAPPESPTPAPRAGLSVDRARLEADVARFAKFRPPGSAEHRRLRRALFERLTELDFAVEEHAYGTGTNVIGRAPAEREESVVVSAHYDHVARCAGADDNASGVAAALEIARLLREKRSGRALVIAFWDEEERGLLGSAAYADRARDRREQIHVAFSLDAIGYASTEPGSQRVPDGFEAALPEQARLLEARGRRGDFIALLANTDASSAVRVFARHARASALPLLSLELSLFRAMAFPDVFRSDHASFWRNGYPAILLSDTADFRNPAYHCGQRPDRPETLDYDFLARVTRATALTVSELLDP